MPRPRPGSVAARGSPATPRSTTFLSGRVGAFTSDVGAATHIRKVARQALRGFANDLVIGSAWYVVCILTMVEMLPSYIIEQLRQREDARRREELERRVQLELPVPVRRRTPEEDPAAPPEEERGVFIIQVG